MFKKFVLAAFALVALAANANGVVDLRIYHASTTADNWPKTLEALTILKVVEGDQVKVGQLLDFPCHGTDWKDVCSDAAVKAAHVAALKSRNPALRGEFISLKELQALGQSQEGINLPVSPAFKAKVDAPVVTTAASAPTPTVAPTTVSAASAPGPKLVTVDRDQVTKWATLAAENDKQLRAQAAQVKDQAVVLAALKTQIGKKEARVVALEQQLQDATAAGNEKTDAIESELQTAKEELAHQRQEAKQAGARLKTVEGDLEQVEGGLTVANADIRKGSWWLVGLTLFLVLFGFGLVVNWRRTAATAQAVKAVPDLVKEKVDEAVGPIADELGAVKTNLETVEDTLEAIAAIATKIAKVEFDAELLWSDLRSIGDGGQVEVVVSTMSAGDVMVHYNVGFVRHGQQYHPTGVTLLSKDETWSAQNVARYLRRAAFERRLTKQVRPRGSLAAVPAVSEVGDTIPSAA